MKTILKTSPLDTVKYRTMDTEDLGAFKNRNSLSSYFDTVINHANIEEIDSLDRVNNKMLIYSNLEKIGFKKTGTIIVPLMESAIDIDPVFFDDMQETYKKPKFTINVIDFTYDDKHIAYYSKELNLLCTTDWTHSFSDMNAMRPLEDHVFNFIRTHIATVNKNITEKEGIIPTIGHDIELELASIRGRTVNASGVIMNRSGRLGTDGAGAQVELRPKPSKNVKEVVADTKEIMKQMVTEYHDYKLSSAGDRYPIGGHIHVGIGHSVTPPQELLTLLDRFLGIPTQKCNGKARGSYARLSAFEPKNWGFEYRSIPGAIGNSPEILEVSMKCVQNLVNAFTKYDTLEFEETPTKEDYMKYCKLTSEEYELLRDFIDNFDKMKKNEVLKNWLKDDVVPVKDKPTVILNFADEWVTSIRDELETLLKTALTKKKIGITVRIYGINQSRGNTIGFPIRLMNTDGTAPVVNVDERFRVNLLSAGNDITFNSVSFGLPYMLRTNNGYFATNKTILVDTIVEQLEPYMKPKNDTRIRHLGELRCA